MFAMARLAILIGVAARKSCETGQTNKNCGSNQYQARREAPVSYHVKTLIKTLIFATKLKDTKIHKVVLGFLCEPLRVGVFVANTTSLRKSGIPFTKNSHCTAANGIFDFKPDVYKTFNPRRRKLTEL